ncbi:M56 family peptidase [Mycolicibacterium sp. CH28]|uniref:M56 family metallopeptidase n=1 Tax=Mycolicibacterium sp. CH28 TaxID=2512237 RepID=UPI0010805E4A|nr:M56 family metallopeptidase [Mycolicibacterium sp. CH28]TGD87402.1 M56 family peptidase [Mycolicibacterium sp. CH28]
MLLLVLAGPWLAAVLLTLFLPRLGVLFTPRWLTTVLAVTGAALALATWMSALAVATIVAGAGSAAARVGAVLLGGWLVWTLLGTVRHALRIRANMRSGRLFRDCPDRVGELLRVESTIPDAFAVPGRRGVVVITSALSSALDDDELRAVLDHERAHLAGHHSLLIQAVQLAACLNPMLRTWGTAVRFAAERAADESAAAGDRVATLRAVARVAVLCSAPPRPAWTGIAGRPGEVIRRVDALQRPGPRRQPGWLLAAAAAVVVVLSFDFVAVADLAQDRVVPERGEPAGQVFGLPIRF